MWSSNKKIKMSLDEKNKLQLACKNSEDLKVISAYLQDSITNLGDMIFLKKNRTFVMMVNRFMWEDAEKGVFRQNKRIRCAVKFEDVTEVKLKNINQKNKNKPLECLAIKSDKLTNGTYKINIFFSGDSVINIVTEVIEVIMQDLGNSWNVKHIPRHKI